MSQTILLIDYEPRTVARVTEALAPLAPQLLVAKDVDTAVAECAKVEPRVVLITSVLPRITIEDAITLLRARAGLRSTPFLILMSGYTGIDPASDAAKIGAQGIIAKPFSNEQLLADVRTALQTPRGVSGSDTRADILDALRKSAGVTGSAGTVTSQELFGDLIESEAESRRPAAAPQVPSPPSLSAPPAAATAAEVPKPAKPKPALSVDEVLESTLAGVRSPAAKPTKPKEEPASTSVDDLLSQTLSGLQVPVTRKPAEKPAAPKPEPAAAAPAPPPAMKAPTPPPQQHPEPKPPAPKPEPPKVEPAATTAIPIAAILPPKPAAPARETAGGPLPQGAPFGHYELMEPIATGGMAEVYKARMRGVEGFQKIVAIKRILPHLTDNDEFVTMFIDEAKLAAQLQHPNIIHIYDLGKIERSYYIAMEYIDGKDLRSILRLVEEKQARLPLGTALYIASRLAAALDYAHRKHDLQGRAMALVHRDVSPQNVLISFDGDIKLCDFGIAKAASKASHTRAGALKGKLQYMSPEQAWGKDIDLRSDIFSLGLVLYEMATGRKAFAGDSELSILEQVRSPQIVAPRDIDPAIPPQIERVIVKALKSNRDERYQTAAELGSDLEGILQNFRPAPGAGELGRFLAELVGRAMPEVAAPLPEVRPATPAPARPEPQRIEPPVEAVPPAAVAESSHPAFEPAEAEIVAAQAPARRSNTTLLAGLGAVAIVGLVLVVVLTRGKAPSGAPETGTPPPEAVEMARQIAAQEVAKQEEAMRQRIAAENAAQTTAGQEAQPATAPTRAAGPTPRSAAAQTPRAEPARTTPPAVTEQATAVPTVAPPPEPTMPAPEPTAPPAQASQEEPVPTRAPIAAAPQRTVAEGDLVDLAAVDTQPTPLETPKPVYPAMANRQRIGGTVILRALVNQNGGVDEVVVLRGIRPDFGLDKAAADALRNWKFRPATKGGVRVKVWYTQSISFRP